MAEIRLGTERAEMMLKRLISECKSACGNYDVRTLKLLDTLWEILLEQKRYNEAEEVAKDTMLNSLEIQPRLKYMDIRVAGLFILARVHKRKNFAVAEHELRQAIELNVSEWGWQHTLTLKYLVHLEDWLRECGDNLQASNTMYFRVNILAAMEGKHSSTGKIQEPREEERS